MILVGPVLRREQRRNGLSKNTLWTTVSPHDAFSAPLAHPILRAQKPTSYPFLDPFQDIDNSSFRTNLGGGVEITLWKKTPEKLGYFRRAERAWFWSGVVFRNILMWFLRFRASRGFLENTGSVVFWNPQWVNGRGRFGDRLLEVTQIRWVNLGVKRWKHFLSPALRWGPPLICVNFR